jgi:prepilin-type N-terminal cleavage/methylation domain-containing protein
MKTTKIKGFTLVELIVVIAIIAVLAAILVPTMMGWIRNSKITTANNNAKEAFNAATTVQSALTMEGFTFYPSGTAGAATAFTDAAIVYPCTTTIQSAEEATAAPTATVFAGYMINEFRTLDGTAFAISMDGKGAVVGAVWAKNVNDTFVGGFPREMKDAKGTVTAVTHAVTTAATARNQ